MERIISAGYFTWLKFLLDKPSSELERLIGYSPGSLAAGWKLLSPELPLSPQNIDLRGSTRWPDGVMRDRKPIGSAIASRSDVPQLQNKIVSFFDRGLERHPAKVFSNSKPQGYPAASPVGIPQFKLVLPISWVVIATMNPGEILRKADITF